LNLNHPCRLLAVDDNRLAASTRVRWPAIGDAFSLQSLVFKSSQVFVYCVNAKEKTDYILIIALTDASMIYREGI